MPTSAHDLLSQIRRAAVGAPADAPTADAAIGAIPHLGRALHALNDDRDPHGPYELRRQLMVRELSTACDATSAQWPHAVGRPTELAAALADGTHALRRQLGADETWALATELAATAGHVADFARRFAPYTRAPVLARVVRVAELTTNLSRLDPPGRAARGVLDRPLAARIVLSRSATALDVPDAVATLALTLEHSIRTRTLNMRDVLIVCAAAESAAQHATAVAHTIAGAPRSPQSGAGDSWRALQAMLMRFDDGSRYAVRSTSPMLERAVALQAALTAPQPPLERLATDARYLANQLPLFATHLEAAARGWSQTGRLFAKARALPRSEERVPELLANRAVLVQPPEMQLLSRVAKAALRESAALARELDRSSGRVGRQPQPHLARALTAAIAPPLPTTTITAEYTRSVSRAPSR